MSKPEINQMDNLVKERIRLPKGGTLYRQGDNATALYGLRSGCFKTQIEDQRGQIQITGFFLPGEVLGLDGMMYEQQASHAIALEDSEVCLIRLSEVDEISLQLPTLQRQLRRLMSKEINRSHKMLLSLGSLRSEQRLAAFLLNLSQRLQLLGYSQYDFILRMSRDEIGNFLGLTLETVSRLFSRFAREGIIKVDKRAVHIIDPDALHQLCGADSQ